MNVAASEIVRLRLPPHASPIDLAHLAHQTLGSEPLKREVLVLFLEHSATVLRQVAEAASPRERREAAHALVGSARGIGAFAVADAAADVERVREPTAASLTALSRAVAEARSAILALLAE